MYNHHRPLKYLSNNSENGDREPPKEDGRPVIDFVNQLCYSMGIDPKIFTKGVGNKKDGFSAASAKYSNPHDMALSNVEEHLPEVEDV